MSHFSLLLLSFEISDFDDIENKLCVQNVSASPNKQNWELSLDFFQRNHYTGLKVFYALLIGFHSSLRFRKFSLAHSSSRNQLRWTNETTSIEAMSYRQLYSQNVTYQAEKWYKILSMQQPIYVIKNQICNFIK